MKISQEEISAAHEALSYAGYNIADDEMERVLEAAYTARKQRKAATRKAGADKLLNAVRELKEAIELGGEGLIVHTPEDIAKRERQRKENDKQVVESAAKRENAMAALAEACGDELVSKAPEWDGNASAFDAAMKPKA